MTYKSKLKIDLLEKGHKSTRSISNVLKFKYEIGYCGLHKVENTYCLYIQSPTKMAPRIIARILSGVLRFNEVLPFDTIEGDIIEYTGSFKLKGERHKDGVSQKSLDKMNRDDSTEVAVPALLETLPDGLTFCAVYGSCDGLWSPRFWVGPIENTSGDTKCVSSKTKASLLERQNHECNECGAPVSLGSYSNSDVDHIIPRKLGGKAAMGNLQVICVPCHRTKTGLEHKNVKRKFISMEVDARGGTYMVPDDSSMNIRGTFVEPVEYIKDPRGVVRYG